MKKIVLFIFCVGAWSLGYGQTSGERLAATAMRLWPETDDSAAARWTYDEGVVWKGLEGMWLNTGDGRYFKYIQRQMDKLVGKDGGIRTPDTVLCGRMLLLLYKVTGQEKYFKAAGVLRQQLREQPRTAEGNLYGTQPFFAEYAALTHADSVFADITKQFVEIGKHARGGKARAMGWYGMALVDVLESYPAGDPGRASLLAIFQRYAKAVAAVQDSATGCWWDILDKDSEQGNYLEASASSMFVYTLAKGVRSGYLAETFGKVAKKGYDGIVSRFLNASNNPDPKDVGFFLLASSEMDVFSDRSLGRGRTVLLDYYFNNEHHKDWTGGAARFHYVWEEMDNNGYSLWGRLFRRYGMKTDSLAVAPTAAGLKKASVYIIVDPDNEKESPAPNFIDDASIAAISSWVNAGGVLVLLGNDSANMEFAHFNNLAGKFGITFNFDDYHKVTGSQFEMGAFNLTSEWSSGEFVSTAHPSMFPTARKVYIKELATLKLSGPAKAAFADKGNVIMAVAKVGKGTVFAVGDPWFYNEYTDGRKLPVDFENFNAARDLTQWLIRQAK